MLSNLIIDGNYILNKNVFTLHKNNLLFGGLYSSLELSINNYRKWYPFQNVYLVSDSKEKSWRKNIYKEYKAGRKRNDDIDWEFVHNTYNEFKENEKRVKILESSTIEGDDWISFIANNSNKEGVSNIIISNDYDIKQLLKYNIEPFYINVMCNEMMNKQKVFFPKNYKIFLDKLRKMGNEQDLFQLNDNQDFLVMLESFLMRHEIIECDPVESLIVKIISGDNSDNIQSAWSVVNNGRKRGIGEKGAKDIYENYITEFGEPDLNDPDLYENIADLICEKKKLQKSQIIKIKQNLENNVKLINLDLNNIPSSILSKMKEVYVSTK